MEFVDGVPITEFCDQQQLSIRDRLMIFIGVCAGVQHAHQKGIIHRDLKPSNILVQEIDGYPVPKVIDFGLAKAIDPGQHLSGTSQLTRQGRILGTFKYMSPEQASLDSTKVDTRTDIYALGVVLYELLTGMTPIDDDTVKGLSDLELLNFIREFEPPKPSRRISSQALALDVINNRQTEAKTLNRILAGDLDWVVIKALDGEPERRYETTAAFADDVDRFLANDPVLARPPSLPYQLNKYISKNRLFVGMIASVGITLIAGMLAASWFAIGKQQQYQIAERRMTQIEKSNDVLTGIFSDINIYRASNEPIEQLLADRVIKAGERLDELQIDPIVLSGMKLKLATSLLNLGRIEQATKWFEQTRDALERELGEKHAKTLESKVALGDCLLHSGQSEIATRLLEKTVPLCVDVLGDDHEVTLSAKNNLAGAYRENGRVERAIEIWSSVLEDRRKVYGENDHSTLLTLNNLGESYRNIGNLDRAKQLLEKFQNLAAGSLGKDHPDTLLGVNNLALVYRDSGDLTSAISLFKVNFELTQSKAGRTHLDTLIALGNLADAYARNKQNQDAIQLFDDLTKRLLETEEIDPRYPPVCFNNAARCFEEIDEVEFAIKYYRLAIERLEQLDFKHFSASRILNNAIRYARTVGRTDFEEECSKLLERLPN